MSKNIEKFHKDVYKDIKPSEELKNRTRMKMRDELKKQGDITDKKVERKKNKFILKPMVAMACVALMVVGINYNSRFNIKPKVDGDKPKVDIKVPNQKEPGGEEKPIGKIAVNIYGVIEKVENGDIIRVKIKDMWVKITDETKFKPLFEGKKISEVFEVGNKIQGFTQDDVNSGEVTALYIYSNENK